MNNGQPLEITLFDDNHQKKYNLRTSLLEFHILAETRNKYQIDEDLFSITGNVILPNFHSVRLFAKKMNEQKDLVTFPEKAIRSGLLNAMGLIDEILHYVITNYLEENGQTLFEEILLTLEKKHGKSKVNQLLESFCTSFPPGDVYRKKISLNDYLSGEQGGISNKSILLEEILMLWIDNKNSAAGNLLELFDDEELEKTTIYTEITEDLFNIFLTKPFYGPDKQDLLTMLRTPAIEVPDSLPGQLQWIKENWGMMLGNFLTRLLSGLDMIKEEEKANFGPGPGPTHTMEYHSAGEEPERFSPDKEWMPKVILMAKSTLVWLDQLSKEYKRDIKTLDQIPDEELNKLQERGFTGLWLIGLWERSSASRIIKQKCGNPEAEASAYSLFDYDISGELGGWESLENLRSRCWTRGIRLASDMVPNHTGIDSRWVSEHPEFFIQLDYPPFPSYTFNGENLSQDSRYGLFLEDHYFDKTDASVVFKRINYQTGEEKYIYHGNDGTHMPWNDTAQIDFLNPEAREAVIQKVLLVARNFPIIRFDAAMTLAKKHIQRLWFPVPGSGGDIPSRAEHGLSQADFDKAIPEEFWREVVDRVSKEVPDTLLLAEAFWMMESYFVRTLGMHRVYNSAFMHMMKNEENKKYKDTIKNTLVFDPQILKRFVNFMNNPDEETAIAQFGKSDKYFGVCTMMITMPGLPMFGHGQIEGFSEKYGMEYRKAYWSENPDSDLINRHYNQIFPLMKKRYLFAEVENFNLYDLWTKEGSINENVFAFSNHSGNEYALVLYNNNYERGSGWINVSVESVEKDSTGEKISKKSSLGKTLNLHNENDYYCIFRDFYSDLWFIRKSSDIINGGLFISLQGFESQVFMDFYEVKDNAVGHYDRLFSELNGKGVPHIERALKEILFRPVYQQLEHVFNYNFIQELLKETLKEESWLELEENLVESMKIIKDFTQGQGDEKAVSKAITSDLKTLESLSHFKENYASSRAKKMKDIRLFLEEAPVKKTTQQLTFTGLAILKKIGLLLSPKDIQDGSLALIDEWMLLTRYGYLLEQFGLSSKETEDTCSLIRILVSAQNWKIPPSKSEEYMKKLLTNQDIRTFIGVNRYNDILWFNKEKFEELIWWLFASEVLNILASETEKTIIIKKIRTVFLVIEEWQAAGKDSSFQIVKLLENLNN